jgi:GT2 family glycosyltransferase
MGNKKDIKVVIGMPCSDSVAMKAKTAHSIATNIIKSEGKVIDFMLQISCDIVQNRTAIVKHALEKGATHLLFVDSDMQFPADALEKLLAHDKDIIGVEYNKRQFPLVPVFEQPDRKDTLYESKAIGTGLMLIKLSIFEKMKDDVWFNFGRDNEGKTTLGEDVWFCYTARDKGFTVWVDPTIKVFHLGEFGY